MAAVEVVPAAHEHIALLSPVVRAADVAELQAAAHVTPEECMALGLRISTRAWTGFVDGQPCCMWGVSPVSVVGGIGAPWMVTTTHLERHEMAFLRRCRRYLVEMVRQYRHLVNYVDARNEAAIRWLTWLGFTMHDPAPYGPDGVAFRRFEMKAGG